MNQIKFETFEDFFTQIPLSEQLIDDCMNTISKPLLHLKAVGVTSKQITDWRKARLLNDDFEIRKWREFSIAEAVWLKFIEQLRHFGMAYEEIRRVKDYFYKIDINKYKKVLNQLENLPNKTVGMVNFIELVKSNLNTNDIENIEQVIPDNFNEFFTIIVMILLTKSNISFYFDDSSFFLLPSANLISEEQNEKIKKLFEIMANNSFAMINIKNLISEFFDNDNLDKTDDFYFNILNNAEREMITKIRSGRYQQVIVKIHDGSIIQFRLKKNEDKDSVKKISRLFKKGDYKEIQLITRDGEVISYNETDIIKLNK